MSDMMAYHPKITILHSLASTLRQAGVTDKVSVISKAKVPIIKFITTHGRFNVDISINQENGIEAGKIINGFLERWEAGGAATSNRKGKEKEDALPDQREDNLALRALVMITKSFLSQRSMNEVFTGGLGSYAIVCLAISFLQMHPKIRRGEIDPNKNLGALLMDYFELYGVYFNYEETGISIREGGMYFNKKRRGWHSYERDKKGLLSLEDPSDPCELFFHFLLMILIITHFPFSFPFYLANDVSRGSYNFHKVRTALAGAFGILTSKAYNQAGILASRRSGRNFSLRDSKPDPEVMSILASIMGVTQEVCSPCGETYCPLIFD
jgi:non-canonical poly(A) RNA polymerase PAPD5/7